MKLSALAHRPPLAEALREGAKIPWHEPEFSERMLREHLTQAHDAASRRSEIVDLQVDWIHGQVLGATSARILDLACGPGLYAVRLAALGHTCVGIDFSPASIRYAQEAAEEQRVDCEFRLEDLRTAKYGADFDLALLIFGELNAFAREEARAIVSRTSDALAPGGRALFELHPAEAVRARGQRPPSWYTTQRGLFADTPHLVLRESLFDDTRRMSVERHLVVRAGSDEVESYVQTAQAYSEDEYCVLFADSGFEHVEFLPSPGGGAFHAADLFVLIATKAGA
jgi:SAM-dependent methyltransferase